MKSSFLLMTALVLATAAAHAQAPAKPPARQLPPPPGPLRPFQFPQPVTKTLANGLTVMVVEDHRQPLLSATLAVNAGAINVETSKAGLAELAANLLRQGTKTRSAQDIAKLVDQVGGTLGANADDDVARVQATFLKDSADLGLELMADITLNPAFQQEEIDRLVKQALSGLQVQYSDPAYLAPVVAGRAIFGEHPYAYPNDGTPETLAALKRDDIVTFHKQYYSPRGAYLVFAGDIRPEEAVAKAEKLFGGWKAVDEVKRTYKPSPATKRQIILVDKPDAVQTQIIVGELGIARNDPEYLPLLIANQIFGGSFNSRLNMKLRANEGLTYGAGSTFLPSRVSGMFQASTFTRTEKSATAIKFLVDLLNEFSASPGTADEIKEAKAYLSGSFVVSSETAAAVAGRVLAAAIYNLPADYWTTYRERIAAVTPEQIAAAVKKRLNPANTAIIAVGNAQAFAKDLESLGTVRIIPLGDLDVLSENLVRAKVAAAPVTAESAAQGKALLAAAVQAMGGLPALNAVKEYEAKGKAKLNTPQGAMDAELTEQVAYPDKFALTLALPFGQLRQGFNGKEAWMAQGPQTQVLPAAMNAELLRSVKTVMAIGLLRDAAEGKAEVQALPPVDFNGKKMDALLWKQGEQNVTLLLDPQSHLITKLSYRSNSPMGASNVEQVWSGHRAVSGLQLPAQVTVFQNGQKFLDQTYSAQTINGGLKPENFSKPQ